MFMLICAQPDPREKLAARFPNYADKFPQWADHSSGMLQYALWVALEAEGMGCNLQHYNPIVVGASFIFWIMILLSDVELMVMYRMCRSSSGGMSQVRGISRRS